MADLARVALYPSDVVVGAPLLVMALYCRMHKTAHELPLDDVEKLVYALGAETIEAERRGAEMPSDVLNGSLEDAQPPCWLHVVHDWAQDMDLYREHVEQDVECREAADV